MFCKLYILFFGFIKLKIFVKLQILKFCQALELFVGKKFYLVMGSKSAFEDLTELLSGTRESNPKNIDSMCVEVSTKGLKSSIEGYDGRYMIIDCALMAKGVQDCSANPRTEFPERHESGKLIFHNDVSKRKVSS